MSIIPEDTAPAFPSPVARDDVRPKLLELLGLESLPDDVAFELDPPEVEGQLRVQRLRFVNSQGETVPGVLCTPIDAEHELPGVVCLPGTGGSAEQLADARFHRPSETSGPLVGWSRELALRGFVTLAIGVKGTEARRASGTLEGWQAEAKLLAPYGRSQMGIVVEEVLGAARVLASADGVDPLRIGLTGMSLGGNATWYAMACAPWIAAGVPICGSPSSLDTVVKLGDPERHSSYFYIPHMLRYFDHADIVAACIFPRPFMMLAPTEDEDTPREGVDRLVQAVGPVYETAGHGERFRVHQPAGKHLYRIEYFELMVDWFGRHLAATQG
jgi:dienelactone hydrolase